MPHYWSEEEKTWLAENYKTYTRKELVPLFNAHFNTDVNENQLIGALKNFKINSGRNGRFPKGNKSWNTGMKGIFFGGDGGVKTRFKKGHKPINYRPVGSERISKDGYIEVKVADPNKWRAKHLVIWEEIYGPIPQKHCLLFLDGNKQNLNVDNLKLITKAQLVRMNQQKLISDIPEITETGIILASISNKIGERKKNQKQKSK